MNPRPFYRWKSFWIWIVLLGFITGTREDSKYHVTGLTLKLPGLFGLTAFRADRAIFLVAGDAENFYNTGFSRADSEALREVRHAAIRGAGFSSVMLTDRLFLFCTSVVGGGFLLWRWRRLKSLQTIGSP